jgi:hypothetical protein
VLGIAKVGIHLTLQRRLQHNLGQLRQQPTLAVHGHAINLSSFHQLGHHLPIHRRRHRHSLRLTLPLIDALSSTLDSYTVFLALSLVV